MKVLITGAAGFIGFHLSKSLLLDGYEVFGIDNINNYYDENLKRARLNELIYHKNFVFNKVDIIDKESLKQVFKIFNPIIVVSVDEGHV